MFWILEKTDGAILGHVAGRQSQTVAAGPFDSYEEAMEEKRFYRRFGCTWYTVSEDEKRPKEWNREYEFSDAHSEFNDV